MSIIDDIEDSKITVHGKTFDVLDIFYIDDTDLVAQFSEQPSFFAYFGTLLAEADKGVALAKTEKERVYATLDDKYRRQFEEDGVKTTETMIRSSVQMDAKYISVVAHEIDAQYESDLLKMITNALKMRAEMLISVGATMRQEYDQTNLRVREAAHNKALEQTKEKLKSRNTT